MHIVEKREVIKANLAYEQPYRFKLWLAAVEDSTSLGMEFRAYLSHIRSSLHIWEKSGTAFVNVKNERLNLDALKADDLWGFLGKREQQPQGPKRYIDPIKIAVLDVYIKKKYPTLAATLSKSTISPEVAAVLRSFFNRGLASEPEADTIGPWSGIYVSLDNLDAHSILSARRRGEIPRFFVRAVMFQPSEQAEFCIAHKVIMSFKFEYINNRHNDFANLQNFLHIANHYSTKDTVIYSGIALVAYGGITNYDVRLPLMLRDRTTYEPHSSQFYIRRSGYRMHETYIRTIFGNEEIGGGVE